MKVLKKVISLNEASKISGYHPDYLSSLIRKEEIKGKKVSGSWFTTEEDIKNYIFKQQVRHKKLALRYFLSQKRTNHIFLLAFIVFGLTISLVLQIYSKNNNPEGRLVNTTLSEVNEEEIIKVINQINE